MKNNNILTEIVRVREIMGLPPIIVEQGTRGKESDDVKGIASRQKECPCNDGSSSPYCCSEEEGGGGPDNYDVEVKEYDSPLFDQYASMGVIPTKDMYLEELLNKYKQELARHKKEESEWESLSEEEKEKRSKEYCLKQYHKTQDYADYQICSLEEQKVNKFLKRNEYLPSIIANMEKHLGMSDEEFALVEPDVRSEFARTQEERTQATKDYNVVEKESDVEYGKYSKRERGRATIKRDEDYEKSNKYANKLVKAFKKKLDKKSLRRWDNKDKDYNEKGWVMSEEDKKELFALFRDFFIEWKNDNPKWVKKYKNKDIKLLREFFSKINLRNVKGPDEIIIKEPIVTPETEPEGKCSIDLGLTEYGIEDGDFQPFVNNRCEIHQDLKDEVDAIVAELGRWKDANPGVEIEVPDYRIFTSASRARNGGQAAKWSFKELSECRAKVMATYINEEFGTIGVTMPTPTIDSNGENGDGSSGPNPPYPFTMVKEGGPAVVADRKDGMPKGKENEGPNRAKYGAPLPCKPTDNKFVCPNYDKWKYCMVDFNIQAWVETIIPEEKPGDPGHEDRDIEIVKTRKWQIKFVPKRKHERATVPRLQNPKIRFNFIRVKKSKNSTCTTCCPTFKDLGSSMKFVGLASGKLIDDVVNNGLASYNGTGWLN